MDGAAYDHLQKAKCRLIMKEPFYGTMTMMFDFREESRIGTMGVRIVSNGVVVCGYNPEFIKSLSLEQLYATIMHECEHIIRLHPLREEARTHDGFNIACDFSINGKKSDPVCAYKEEGRKAVVPIEDGCFIPEDWPAHENAETYYDMLPKCKTCHGVLPWDQKTGKAAGDCNKGKKKEKCGTCGKDKPDKQKGQQQGQQGQGQQGQGQQGQGQGQQQGQQQGQGQGNPCPECGQDQNQGQGQGQGQQNNTDMDCPDCGRPVKPCGDYRDGNAGGVLVDDHTMWHESDVSEDEARQIVRQIVEQASSNSQGRVPGHLKEFIDKLNKPVVRWREVIRRFLGRHAGGCRRTYARRNRRMDAFGVKGTSHHAVATLGVIIDTSGSIGTEELKQFFAEIEAISSKTKTWILQWDAQFRDFQKRYRRGDWKTMEIKGRGGTLMNDSQDWVVDNKIEASAVIMLTDGHTPWRAEPMPMPFFVCLTADTEGNLPDYAEHIKMPMMK